MSALPISLLRGRRGRRRRLLGPTKGNSKAGAVADARRRICGDARRLYIWLLCGVRALEGERQDIRGEEGRRDKGVTRAQHMSNPLILR